MDRANIRPLTGNVGAEITGVDLSQAITPALSDDIRAALDRYQVVFFPPHAVSQSLLLGLAQAIGTPVEPLGKNAASDHAEVAEFVNMPVTWHADITFLPRPPGEQVFQVVELPAVGGDTLWASTEAAYASLNPGLRTLVDGMTAIHDDSKIHWLSTKRSDVSATEHPVVRIHPRSGRPSLFVNPFYTSRIVGLSEIESRHLLDLLFAHIAAPEHCVRYRWTQGSIAVWDNRATWHYAVGDYGKQPRRVQRVSTAGETPAGSLA
jgi:alpha-ketoglutarate-dependent taurine dioxygenase